MCFEKKSRAAYTHTAIVLGVMLLSRLILLISWCFEAEISVGWLSSGRAVGCQAETKLLDVWLMVRDGAWRQ